MAKIDFFDWDTTPCYGAHVRVDGNEDIVDERYTTKREAVNAVNTAKRAYRGSGKLDCFVRLYDKYGFAVRDWNI